MNERLLVSIRKLDDMGRITLPVEVRRELGWVNEKPVGIYTQGEKVILSNDKNFVRKFDQLGRITIPKEFRRLLGWNAGDNLAIYTIGNKVELLKHVSGTLEDQIQEILDNLDMGSIQGEQEEKVRILRSLVGAEEPRVNGR